ncbi:ABC transporter ATP-binding protein [Streptomyces sp. NPDC008343]|uniref:ABC transporter ATP-binding protein n=1 Tax=Streptomyces sp. NPDC008343 TaxID=3364828 RepID=UPI0036EBDCD7
MTDVQLRNLVKTYPGSSTRATDEVSLDIADGEFMVLLGPSGCGKTTLLRMLAGLELPDAGQIVVGGRDVTYLPPKDRNLSMVFQSYAVFPHRKVRDNIGFGLAMRGMDRNEIRRKVDWAADLLQLGAYLDRYPTQLSGGQRQRVAVARAIVVDADVLLMDEPLSNLDALLRLSFRSELKKLVEEIGITTLYVTHDQSEALSLGNRVAVMREGVIVQCDDPLMVYDRPASRFVGGFIGSPPMNFLTVQIDKNVDGPGTAADLGGHVIPAPAALRTLHGGPVHLGVRAETIAISHDPGAQAVRATVRVFEPLGSAVLVSVDVEGQEIKVQAPNTFRAAPGDTVWLTFAPSDLRWYDAETDLALETV